MGLSVACCDGTSSSLESGETCCELLRSRLSGGLSSFHCISPGELECSGCFQKVLEIPSLQVGVECCNVTISAERVRGTVSHIGVLYLVSEQFFPCEPDGGNCYASEHNLNQRIMREMLPKAII
ncbi:hypothetical protein PIB30_105251 [Stylosanthes scabra]|uniref:Uncharacterized protein n=1 Tax=Stylosanthes scabra TaxID=79078 RepID=A0ABU6VYI4_9FABA|nr:hypothetical protein [Stylosanthes scabra]